MLFFSIILDDDITCTWLLGLIKLANMWSIVGTLDKELRPYLNSGFPKGSIDHDTQMSIRENLFQRTVPCKYELVIYRLVQIFLGPNLSLYCISIGCTNLPRSSPVCTCLFPVVNDGRLSNRLCLLFLSLMNMQKNFSLLSFSQLRWPSGI